MARLTFSLLAGGGCLLLGAWNPFRDSGSSAAPPPDFGAGTAFLMDLHLHGSLSERSGTMANHTAEAAAAGYDGLWWTDHMGRNFAEHFASHRVPLDDSLFTTIHPWAGIPIGKLEFYESRPGGATLGFLPMDDGSRGHARVQVQALPGEDWIHGEFSYQSLASIHRVSLFAEPHVVVDMRPFRAAGDATFLFRLTLSSDPDGATPEGAPRILEFVLEGAAAPPPAPNAVRRALPAWTGWRTLDLDVADVASRTWPHAPDLGLRDVSLFAFARDGGQLELDLSEFRLVNGAPMDLEMFRAQERYLAANQSAQVFHHVGMEVGDAMAEQITPTLYRDHLIALFPGQIPELLYLRPDNPVSAQHPRGSVEWLHRRGALAILAHPFGTGQPPQTISAAQAAERRAAILDSGAYGADGVEVGYFHRGRPLAEHLELWDMLSTMRVYVTGVGVSDNHTVEPWSGRVNRMGSWIRARSSLAPDLVEAVRAGDLFFGDPFRFDPAGDFLLDEENGNYAMGDVVRTPGRVEHLRVRVRGCRAGDWIRVVRNGAAPAASEVRSFEGSFHFALMLRPGDWVRGEMLDPSGQPYLFTNPIYFVAPTDPVPPHRAP